MSDDWIRPTPEIRSPPKQKTISPDQLQDELQRAFDAVNKRILELEHTVAAQAQVQNLTLRAFVDLGIADYDAVLAALTQIEEGQGNDAGRERIKDMKISLQNSVAEKRPRLALVPKPDRQDE